MVYLGIFSPPALCLPWDYFFWHYSYILAKYLYKGSCRPCPFNCSSCVSDTNCTVCEKGFYGPACEHKYLKNCTCHKTYGYCTEGCPDKEYPQEGNGCGSCPGHCALCESQSKCILCEDGFFGVTCQDKCHDQCARCHNTTGQCFQCKDSYYLLSGQCNSCPHGCSSCNTTDNCQSCEDAFNGPFDGRCFIKCPGNGVIKYVVPDKNGRCGLWQDINNNICNGHSQSQSCISSGNCLQYVRPCLVAEDCVTNTHALCGNVTHYKCKHICSRIGPRYWCEDTCIVYGIPTDNTAIICFANALTVRQTFQNQVDCNQEEVSRTGNDSSSMKDAIIGVLSTVALVLVIVLVIVFGVKVDKYRRKRCQKVKVEDENKLSENHNESGQADGNPKSDESERQPESESAEHDNNTDGKFGSKSPTTNTMDTGYEGSRAILDSINRQNKSETPKSAESSSSQPLLDRTSPETGHKESKVGMKRMIL